jgi:hypothetical protein
MGRMPRMLVFEAADRIEANLIRVIRLGSMSSTEITSCKPTCRYLCACPDLDYFRFADNPARIPRCGYEDSPDRSLSGRLFNSRSLKDLINGCSQATNSQG